MQKFALKVWTKHWSYDYESLLQLCKLPTLASRRHYLKLCVLYQVVNGHLDFPMAPVVPQNLPRSFRNTSTLALERPVTRTNAYISVFIFPTYNHPVEQPTFICTELPDIATDCITSHFYLYLIPYLTHV